MRYKERPCPGGCGNIERRPPQMLCQDCTRQLKMGKKREQEINSISACGEKIRIAIDTGFHYSTGAFLSFLGIKDTDILRALVQLGGLEHCQWGSYKDARFIHYKYSIAGGWCNRPTRHVWATPKQADDIELILDYIKLVIEKAYEDGKREGSSIIRNLAAAGIDELNRISIGERNDEKAR